MFDFKTTKAHRQLSPRQQENLLVAVGQIRSKNLSEIKRLEFFIGANALEALVFCCFHSGIEALEKHMKWPARSGWTCLGLIADKLENVHLLEHRKIG